MNQARNLYEQLDIPPASSPEEIRRIIDQRRRWWAPLQQDPARSTEAVAALRLAAEAEAVLLDPRRRMEHDELLGITVARRPFEPSTAAAASAPAPTSPPASARARLVPAVMIGVIVTLVVLIGAVLIFGRDSEDVVTSDAGGSDPERPTTSDGPSDLRPGDAGSSSTASSVTTAEPRAGSPEPMLVPTTGTTATTSTTAPPPQPVTSRVATVNRTCGDGNSGDCFVALRRSPTTDATKLGELTEGSTVDVVCQEWGESVYSSVLDATSRVWVMSTDGSYMAGVFLDVPGWGLFDVTEPC